LKTFAKYRRLILSFHAFSVNHSSLTKIDLQKEYLMKAIQRGFAKTALLLIVTCFSTALIADDVTALPEPLPSAPQSTLPQGVAPQKTTPSAQTASPQSATPQACRKASLAEVFVVKDLQQCGTRLDNSGLGGVLNRGRRCVQEKVVAQVFAAPCTCEDCASQTKVEKIRCDRGDACLCENEAYVKSLITSLMENSRNVRRATVKNLKKCGFRVDETLACVEEKVPSAYLY
jgi:hypothetical protein